MENRKSLPDSLYCFYWRCVRGRVLGPRSWPAPTPKSSFRPLLPVVRNNASQPQFSHPAVRSKPLTNSLARGSPRRRLLLPVPTFPAPNGPDRPPRPPRGGSILFSRGGKCIPARIGPGMAVLRIPLPGNPVRDMGATDDLKVPPPTATLPIAPG